MAILIAALNLEEEKEIEVSKEEHANEYDSIELDDEEKLSKSLRRS